MPRRFAKTWNCFCKTTAQTRNCLAGGAVAIQELNRKNNKAAYAKKLPDHDKKSGSFFVRGGLVAVPAGQ